MLVIGRRLALPLGCKLSNKKVRRLLAGVRQTTWTGLSSDSQRFTTSITSSGLRACPSGKSSIGTYVVPVAKLVRSIVILRDLCLVEPSKISFVARNAGPMGRGLRAKEGCLPTTGLAGRRGRTIRPHTLRPFLPLRQLPPSSPRSHPTTVFARRLRFAPGTPGSP